jgi:predicted small integral membrane protein
MRLFENFSENKTLIMYMFLTEYMYSTLCMYGKYSEYNSNVCIIYMLMYMQKIFGNSCFHTTKIWG